VGMLHDRYGADAVQFWDMDFFVSEARAVEFAERIEPLGMSWWGLGRVDELMRYRDASWEQLRRSGLKMVFCGAESGSDAVLARMNKGGRASSRLTLELARRMRHYGVVPEFSFVLGNPPDPEADIAATLAFVRELKQANSATELILYMYSPVPQDGTLYDEARALGFRFPESLDEWVRGDWQSFSVRRDPGTPWLPPRLTRRVRNFESVLNAYYPTVTDTRLTGARRALLRGLSAFRYHTGIYAAPLELRALQRVMAYQRPETTGF
jgi:anaerobic magnesium-protoporphyrin IX monomethyl ester cyclase